MFQLSALIVVFLLGGILAANDMQPFRTLFRVYGDMLDIKTEVALTHHKLVLTRTRRDEGITVHDATRAYAGYTVIQGVFDEGVQVRLLDMQGHRLHTWNIDYFAIWPEPPPYLEPGNVPNTVFDYHSQGMSLLRDGSIVVSLGNLGAVKLDKCSRPLWTVNRATHHVVTAAPDGGFWLAGNRSLADVDDSLVTGGVSRESLGSSLGRFENLLIKVDAHGKVTREFSVLTSLIAGHYLNEVSDSMLIDSTDPTHVNDIELVTPALASKIPGIEPGDLLVSIRQMHLLAIFDVDDGSVLWASSGPWIRQHDPDIGPEGNIVVFDNGDGHIPFSPFGGSSLVELDPSTRAFALLYPKVPEQRFFTDIMGAHQLLPNGNRLVIESRRGRAFEIAPDGGTVWELVQPYDATHAALIELAERVDYGFFEVSDWSCSGSRG